MNFQLLSLLFTLAPTILADVQFVQPAAGASFKAGSTLAVSWKDSGSQPALSSLTNYVLQLCAGGNEEGTFIPIAPLKPSGVFSAGNIAAGLEPVDPAVGANSPNGYFLMIAASGPGGSVTNYSPRFGLTGMTAQFPANVEAGIADIGSSTSGPKSSVIDSQTGGDEGADAPAGSYAVPYNEQQGLTRYAPMQPQPGTKITANPKTVKPLHTPSSAPIAPAFLPTPKIQTTMTQSRPVTVTSTINNASPAPMPEDSMQKFLNRWKD